MLLNFFFAYKVKVESLKLETVLYVIRQFKVGLFLISSIIHIMAISFLAVGENCFKILT